MQKTPLLHRQVESVRKQILEKIPGYIKILDDNINGRLTVRIAGDPHGKRRFIELSASKLRSIEILFNKAVPNLQSQELRVSSDMGEMSSDDILARMKLILSQRPELLTKLIDQNTKLVEAKVEVQECQLDQQTKAHQDRTT